MVRKDWSRDKNMKGSLNSTAARLGVDGFSCPLPNWEGTCASPPPPFPGALTILSIFLSCQMVESLEGHWDTFIPFEGGHFPTESE